MSVIRRRNGATLIEAMLAAVFIATTAIWISLTLPKVSHGSAENRKRATAVSLANAQMENVVRQPYAFVVTTGTTSFQALNTSCDCREDNLSGFSSTPVPAEGTTFELKTCVHFVGLGVGNSWTSRCPAAGDAGYKNVVVRASWNNGGSSKSVSAVSLKTNY